MPLPLRTERLLLRPPVLEDLDAWLAILRDAEEVWYGAARSSEDDARASLMRHVIHHERYGWGICAAELRATGKVIGAAGITHMEDGPELEVGYRFRKEHWGQGLATEAAAASIAFGFGELGLDRIVAVALPTNKASRRVMEKCGLSFVGVTEAYGEAQVKYAIAR